MNFKINSNQNISQDILEVYISNFYNSGKIFSGGNRNTIKLFELDGKTINIKSFKIPHFINKIAYRYFRKSKAKRSFEFATRLLEMNIGTPQPIAFYENYDFVGLKDSYYVCEHLADVFEFRDLVENKSFENRTKIIRQFAQFSFKMHQKGIEFLDHSPGNTLIQKRLDGDYEFYLVDLNRMNFHSSMDFELRMKNLSRLTPHKEMIEIMSSEYAKVYPEKKETEILAKMWFYTNEFQEKFQRKKRIKKVVKFWKK